MKHIITNAQTGEVTEVPFTAQEVEAYEANAIANATFTNKMLASQLLMDTDWVEVPSVSDNQQPVYLTNLNEYQDYRLALRQIAVNPTHDAEFPIKPTSQWAKNETV